ncbi:ATP-binding protein [Microbulbifer thermotolerans]|uniref:ATP-binding protein n=1 Tax=Microbulbifer thermotolerans TaxID=252514 RepID=UPI00224B4DA4|nr:ATP-binding protein [Microbulbifer thermotolerans]MCX2778625.1 ATP-binding protein [Microbulbifer thermotolerans]MCX2803866.1 ATP-binding protein [Microbulbifer thermotolerans]
MIEYFSIRNSGPIAQAEGQQLGKLNLFIGKNGCGKTWLLKTLYCVMRIQEEFGRGNDNRDFHEVLSDKLYWTFQSQHLGDLVRRGKGNRLEVKCRMDDGNKLEFSFGPDTSKQVKPAVNTLPRREDNSVFLPPKEVLSLWNVISKSAIQNREFGFDATYSDLVLALQNPTQRGRNYKAFASSREKLEGMFQGKVVFEDQKWIYRQGNSKFSIHSTAEGIKKIAILDTLLGNRFLTPGSVIFIDEPESALHPTAIVQLLDILSMLASQGIQIFMASHSYYVVKKMLLIAKQTGQPVPCFIADDENCWQQSCLLEDGLPDNEIINESVRLFEQEFEGI